MCGPRVLPRCRNKYTIIIRKIQYKQKESAAALSFYIYRFDYFSGRITTFTMLPSEIIFFAKA